MKNLVLKLWFSLKDNSNWIYSKKYHDNTIVEVDFEKQTFHFGWKIKIYSKEIQNISKSEDWVVFECVDRLLEKWYYSEDILLEKVYPTWRWTSWRLDIFVMKNKKAFLMIECKTWESEFEKEYKNIQRNWWQIFTYFQQDRDAEFLMLYASKFDWKDIAYKNEIVKIEESYRETSNVADFYARWNKFTKQNGIFENWVNAYNFESKALTKKDLVKIKQVDSSIIFNRFLEILRHNTVSDKPNAFNKMFTLFLCKIHDEWTKWPDDELEFQFKEWIDTDVSFQVRLTDLYKRWMMEFLKKEITDFNDDEFNKEFWEIEPSIRIKILEKITKLRLQKNNEFAIKEVFDEETFIDNAKVLKEVVELLQVYQIRYAEKQPFLWDFFELLLTTWLKQESWQFFTPVPIARFICKSIPLDTIIQNKLLAWDTTDLLPSIIDYAAWSGHFLTESMEEIQNIINKIDENSLKPNVAKEIKKWKGSTFDWALEYMYGIEKDYRLVKTAKVGCYLHGDGIATVIHGDWLDSFEFSKHYRGKLSEFNPEDKQENAKFDLVLSNSPYSVSAFKWNLDREKAIKDFNLYDGLSYKSSEIECLFIERTKQLLHEGWIASIILPSSILNNTWVYTKAREIILKNFEIISIVSLGSGTFMATGTNTVVLFMRKRNKFFAKNLEASINKFFINLADISLNNIENVFSKYVSHTWWVALEDYKTICQKAPNEAIKNSDLFKDFINKSKWQKVETLYENIIEIEKEKILYFVLSYRQNVVLVKSWEKQEEKEFLGYEFSNRKWSEWIHPTKWWKLIDDCTKLFDPKVSYNEEKVSTYIYDGFNNNFEREIHEELKNHIFRTKLVDLLTFDRTEFEKTISTNTKKKIEIESKWDKINLWEICEIIRWVTYWKDEQVSEKKDKSILPADNISLDWKLIIEKEIFLKENFKYDESKRLMNGDIFMCFSSWSIRHLGKVAFINKNTNYFAGWFMWIIRKINDKINIKYLFLLLNLDMYREYVRDFWSWSNINNLSSTLTNAKIPLPPLDIQQKIVDEIEVLEMKEKEKKEKVESLKESISKLLPKNIDFEKIENISLLLKRWKSPKYWNSNTQIIKSGQARWNKSFDFSERYFVSDDYILDERKLKKWDILINSTGVWTAGRVTLFDLEGDFVVDSHITILRLNKQKALSNYIINYFVDLGFKTIEAMALGQSGQIELSLETIKNIKIPLPSLETQKEIVSQIEEIEKKIEVLESDLKAIPEKKKEVLKKYL